LGFNGTNSDFSIELHANTLSLVEKLVCKNDFDTKEDLHHVLSPNCKQGHAIIGEKPIQ
jgi:hypothetical protein